MKMKTYYSVVYSKMGADKPTMAWFNDTKEAREFAAGNYKNDPVKHHVSSPKTIKDYDERVALTQYYGD